jgi:hypothetical protein
MDIDKLYKIFTWKCLGLRLSLLHYIDRFIGELESLQETISSGGIDEKIDERKNRQTTIKI